MQSLQLGLVRCSGLVIIRRHGEQTPDIGLVIQVDRIAQVLPGQGDEAGGNQKPLPNFATGSVGGNAGAGTDKNIFNFGFQRLREPEKKE